MVIWAWLLAFNAAAASNVAVYPPQKINARGIERLEITGVRGQLKLVYHKGRNFYLKVRHSKNRSSDDWNLSVERRGKTLVLEVFNSAYGREWRRVIRRSQWPEFDIELVGPSRPAIISWLEGGLQFVHWNSDIDASFLSGNLSVSGGGGHYHLQAISSSVDVQEFHGDLSLSGSRGDVHLKSLSGDLNLNWLNGNIVIDRAKVKAHVDSGHSALRLTGCTGHWRVQASAGEVSVRGFHGKFKGRGQTAHWDIQGQRKSDIEVVNASGPVQVHWVSPMQVFLTSSSGRIHSPFSVRERGGFKVSRGQKGRRANSQLFVRTDSGDIRFNE